jgi:hypothetical protein
VMGSRLGGTEYPAAAQDDKRNILTVRDSPHGTRREIHRSDWSFTHNVDGKLSASDRFLHLNTGFVPGKIYELVYVVQDPVVAGLGFAAVRDFVAWMKHSPEAIAPVKYAYGVGISQCGRFLRDFLYEGFNADETGNMVLDGVLAHVGGGGRGSFNYRFAQPSRDAQPMSSIDWPTDIFPFTDLPETDPDNPHNGKLGLLDASTADHVAPKIFSRTLPMSIGDGRLPCSIRRRTARLICRSATMFVSIFMPGYSIFRCHFLHGWVRTTGMVSSYPVRCRSSGSGGR